MRSPVMIMLLVLSWWCAAGQVQPPSLTCIEGSGTQLEIFWTPPATTCGPLTGYEVFYATSPNGPYSSFTVANPATTDTVFANTDPIVYCFMQSMMDCPGESPVNSDTLIWDLNPPVMKTVSVNDAGGIEVTWHPSASPDIAAYLVYVDGGNIPDTVYGNGSDTYIDAVSDPTTGSHNYKVAWWRNCVDDGDRRGSIGLPYNTIWTQNLQQDRCGRSFSFSWNRYENYDAGVIGYEVEASLNGGAFAPVDTLANDRQVYAFMNAQTDVYYCFRVNALLPDGCKALSSIVCDTATVVQVPLGGQVRNATVLSNATIQVEYYRDTVGDIQLFNGERSTTGSNFGGWPLDDRGPAGNPAYNIFQDNNVNPQGNDYYYRFKRQDECDVDHFSDTVKTMLLDAGIGPGFSGELEWTAYFNSNATVTSYTVLKIVNGIDTDAIELGPGALSYTDFEALNTTSLDTVCYRIVAEADLDVDFIPGTMDDVVYSYSNVSCLNPKPRVIFPSAFRPEGFNRIFKPIISFGTAANYNFRIYDRYGRKLFETESVDEGWDGTDGGEIAPMNNYVYYLTFTGQDGILYTDTGNVILVR